MHGTHYNWRRGQRQYWRTQRLSFWRNLGLCDGAWSSSEMQAAAPGPGMQPELQDPWGKIACCPKPDPDSRLGDSFNWGRENDSHWTAPGNYLTSTWYFSYRNESLGCELCWILPTGIQKKPFSEHPIIGLNSDEVWALGCGREKCIPVGGHQTQRPLSW
jgi:hypothetical protein